MLTTEPQILTFLPIMHVCYAHTSLSTLKNAYAKSGI